MIDNCLAKQLQFIKEGKFVEKDGAKTLKLVGEVVPVDAVEVEKLSKKTFLENTLIAQWKCGNVLRHKCQMLSKTRSGDKSEKTA